MENVSLKNVSHETRERLLNELGYFVKGRSIFDSEGVKVVDRYLGVPVKIDKMVILPGSTIILDDNELSVALYLDEYGQGDC